MRSNDIDVSDVKIVTNVKDPVVGHIWSEIKADTQIAIDVVEEDEVLVGTLI